MSYNKQYNTRFSGRYNTPGQFVSAGESFSQTPRKQAPQPNTNVQPVQQSAPATPLPNDDDSVMDNESVTNQSVMSDDGLSGRPHWMKTRLPGVKKVSNKERRRRQNESLRRLLTPKNALMVLNEMMPKEQVANQFKVEQASNAQYNAYKAPNAHTFCADLTIEENVYKGYGDNKLMARNAAAEQAIRDIIIKKMTKAINSDSGSLNGASDSADEEALPMIQLASFALHKLFTEWEYEGHKVPQLKPQGTGGSVQNAPKRGKELPVNAAAMHPAMLLTYMRPHLEYREVAAEGDRPQNMLFTMAVDVDGTTYLGKASNKKEARKAAAKAACEALFNVEFEPNPVSNAPVIAPAE